MLLPNAPICGRSRRNDPYTGRDDAPNQPQPNRSSIHSFPLTFSLCLHALSVFQAPRLSYFCADLLLLATLALFWLLVLITGTATCG